MTIRLLSIIVMLAISGRTSACDYNEPCAVCVRKCYFVTLSIANHLCLDSVQGIEDMASYLSPGTSAVWCPRIPSTTRPTTSSSSPVTSTAPTPAAEASSATTTILIVVVVIILIVIGVAAVAFFFYKNRAHARIPTRVDETAENAVNEMNVVFSISST